MMKKIIAYQKLLACAVSYSDTGHEVIPVQNLFILVLSLAMIPVTGFSILKLSIPLASTYCVYRAINSKTRLFELIPVTTKYTFANLYLFPVWVAIATYIALQLLLIVMFLLLLGLALIFGSVSMGGPSAINPAELAGEWKNVVFSLMLYTLTLFVVTTLSFVRQRKIRLIGIGIFTAIVYALLWAVKLTLPKVPDSVPAMSGIDIMPYFSLHPHADSILIWLGLVCAVLIPASVLFGRQSYRPHDFV